jgi:hypothetical protein
MKLRLATRLAGGTAGALLLLVGLAAPAFAVTFQEKLAVMSSWSQTSRASYNAWNDARNNQGAWSAYTFDWSTDFCSASPDQPLGFDFRLSCHRHDFGYRNYKAVSQFPANKSRIDDYFYADLRAKCATYNVFVRPACYSLAWTYYEAVSLFGALSLPDAELQKARALKQQGEAAAAAHAAKRAA